MKNKTKLKISIDMFLPLSLILEVFFQPQMSETVHTLNKLYLLLLEVLYWPLTVFILLSCVYIYYINKSKAWASNNEALINKEVDNAKKLFTETRRSSFVTKIGRILIPFEASLIIIGLDDFSFGFIFVVINLATYAVISQSRKLLDNLAKYKEREGDV